MVYRFKVAFEEYDDVYRIVEIRSNQTFEDLHTIIQKVIGFDASKSASFFMSDDYWRKGREITLKDGDIDPDAKKVPKLMSKCRLLDFVEDPRQKILYVFDFDAQWTFTIELAKIVNDEAGVDYPQCIKTFGAAPKQYKPTTAPPVDEEDDEEDDPIAKKEKIFQHEEGIDRGEHDEDDDPFGEEEKGEEDEAEGAVGDDVVEEL